MPFQGKNPIELETEKAFIMVSQVTKPNEMFCQLSSLTQFSSEHTEGPRGPSAKNLQMFLSP